MANFGTAHDLAIGAVLCFNSFLALVVEVIYYAIANTSCTHRWYHSILSMYDTVKPVLWSLSISQAILHETGDIVHDNYKMIR